MAEDDRQLFEAIEKGGEPGREAFRVLYERYAGDVLRFLRRLLGSVGESEARDLLHEVFLTASRSAEGFRAGSALPWLLAIAGRRVHTHQRSERRRRAREAHVAEDAPRVAGDEDPTDELERALSGLPAHLRATVELRVVDELTHADVANVLGVSLRTAKDWSRRGLDELRRRLERGAT